MATDLTQVQKKLWDAADELRANSGLQGLGVLRARARPHLPALRRGTLRCSPGRARHGQRPQPRGTRRLQGPWRPLPPGGARYDHLLSQPESADLGRVLNNAMSAIEDHNPDLKGVLPKVYGTLPNNVLVELLRTLNSLADDIEGDGFGLVYEYFLGQFAMAEGQGGGEFFTPTSIVKLIVEILEPFHGKIYDPACGSGGMFVQSADFVARHKRNPGSELSIYGQEASRRTVPLAKMNLARSHGLGGDILEGNTYYEDRHDSVGKFDFVMANPPFNVNKVDKAKLEDDPRFRLGLPSTDNANYLWIQAFHSALNDHGRAGFVMANSASDAIGSELAIRQKLVEAGVVDVVVAVGTNMFFPVTLPVTLWFLTAGSQVAIEPVKCSSSMPEMSTTPSIAPIGTGRPIRWSSSRTQFDCGAVASRSSKAEAMTWLRPSFRRDGTSTSRASAARARSTMSPHTTSVSTPAAMSDSHRRSWTSGPR